MRSGKYFLAIPLICVVVMAMGADDVLEPKIAPGYKPEEANDEKGVWMELEEYELAIQRSALLVDDPYINAYVRDAACRVAGEYCRDLRIYIVRNPGFNASMTANGILQVWTGLLLRVSSEDELAAVLGHELAHYTQLHTLERMRRTSDAMSTGSIFDLGLIMLTGVNIPVGQLTAVTNVTAFSRGNETEADLMGVKYMAEAGYDPRAAAAVWKTIVEEEARDIKDKDPGIFGATHPSSADRIVRLQEFVTENYPDSGADSAGRAHHVELLNEYYMMLMEDQIDTNRFGRTEAMLDRHRRMGVNEQLVHYFHGEMYRQRNADGDIDFAIEAYSHAAKGDAPVADAYLNLGYIYLKRKDLLQAQSSFRKYLELEPDADDREMIEFYLQEN